MYTFIFNSPDYLLSLMFFICLQTSTVQVSQTDIDSLLLRASNALIPVLDKLYEKAFASYRVSKYSKHAYCT